MLSVQKRPGEEAADKPAAKKPATAAAADTGQSLADGGDVLEGTGVNIEEEAVALRGADSALKATQELKEERLLNKVPCPPSPPTGEPAGGKVQLCVRRLCTRNPRTLLSLDAGVRQCGYL